MALKDWKLIGKKLGMNHDITQWVNIKNNHMISMRKNWNEVDIYNKYRGIIKSRKFKTEASKLKFAKSYMRKH